MKKSHIFISALSLIVFAYCKSTKTSSASPTAVFPEQKQVDVASARWPGTTADDLKRGQSIYVNKCTECHKNFEITRFTEKKWLHEIDDMSPKAKLTPEEKLALTKHILSYREAYTVVKAQ